jgi:high-affinity Fe2+/Pb2+ permease
MKLPPLNTLGAPEGRHRHHWLRWVASVIAAVAGAAVATIIGLLVVGAITPGMAAEVYGVVLLLLLVWLSGIWWRWDSPDMRDANKERERRGY